MEIENAEDIQAYIEMRDDRCELGNMFVSTQHGPALFKIRKGDLFICLGLDDEGRACFWNTRSGSIMQLSTIFYQLKLVSRA